VKDREQASQAIVVFRSPGNLRGRSRRERAAHLREATRGHVEELRRAVREAGLENEVHLERELWASGSVIVTATPRALEAIRKVDAVAEVAPGDAELPVDPLRR
jgi:hypothetical protein